MAEKKEARINWTVILTSLFLLFAGLLTGFVTGRISGYSDGVSGCVDVVFEEYDCVSKPSGEGINFFFLNQSHCGLVSKENPICWVHDMEGVLDAKVYVDFPAAEKKLVFK